MAAVLEAFLVPTSRAVRQSIGSVGAVFVPLQVPGLDLVPITSALSLPTDGSGSVPEGFYELTPAQAAFGRSLSVHGKAGYLHLEFHGGVGFQAAIGWDAGVVAWGPEFTANEPADPAYVQLTSTASRDEWAVNRLLRWLGAERGASIDEFSAAGLGAHRSTDQWVAAGTAPA